MSIPDWVRCGCCRAITAKHRLYHAWPSGQASRIPICDDCYNSQKNRDAAARRSERTAYLPHLRIDMGAGGES